MKKINQFDYIFKENGRELSDTLLETKILPELKKEEYEILEQTLKNLSVDEILELEKTLVNLKIKGIVENEPSGDGVIRKVDEQIKRITKNKNQYNAGKITKIKDYIVEITGLNDVGFYEKVIIGDGGFGYITKIESNYVIAALVSLEGNITVGDLVYQTNEEFTGEFSFEALGKISNMFGVDHLVNKKFQNTSKIVIESENVSIMDRIDVKRPLLTGIAGVDLLYPIGKGQRQLVIGDKKTGKTQITLDTIVNQKGKNVICIYCAIGKTKREIKEIYYELMKKEAMEYTYIITAFNDDLAPVLVLTPYFAMSVAQKLMYEGIDVLLIIDDLKRHADAAREIALLSDKVAGRDAYPSDIFYLHSRLLEKGCQYKNGGSITVLPIVETKNDDISDYISTNLISITDGQIVLSNKNFQRGEKPAINYGLSVSRLGGAVQSDEMKTVGSYVRRFLLSYLETREIYELANIDEMSPILRQQLSDGQKIIDELNQHKFSPLDEITIARKFDFLKDKDG